VSEAASLACHADYLATGVDVRITPVVSTSPPFFRTDHFTLLGKVPALGFEETFGSGLAGDLPSRLVDFGRRADRTIGLLGSDFGRWE